MLDLAPDTVIGSEGMRPLESLWCINIPLELNRKV